MSRVVATALALLVTSLPLAAQRTVSADEKELAAYRLTMPIVKKAAAVTMALAAEAEKDPKVQELNKLKSEMKTLGEKEERTEAEDAKLEKLAERAQELDAEIDAKSQSSSPDDTLADMEARIRKHPQALAIMAREGITPRDYVRSLMALLQAAMVEGFSQGKADLAKLPAGINPENVKFVRENKAELEAMQQAFGGKPKK